jgi:predicted dehydrogenase
MHPGTPRQQGRSECKIRAFAQVVALTSKSLLRRDAVDSVMIWHVIRWGIVATGGIAQRFAHDLALVDDAAMVAVGSRTMESARRFADEWGIDRCYGSYDEVSTDPDVDVVYIATPHHLHFDNIVSALEGGKHVVCEKPLTLNATQARAAAELAQSKNLFLLEAVWMKFNPAIRRLDQWVRDGTLGEIVHVQVDNSFLLPFDPTHRLYDLEQAGGALLDLGIYPLAFATMVLGWPESAEAAATWAPSGVDDTNAYLLRYPNAHATLSCGLRADRPAEAIVSGTLGTARVRHHFICPDRLVLRLNGSDPVAHEIPPIEASATSTK